MREVLFVAGEASGDLHAAGVADELARLRPDLELRGIGGDRMAAAGVQLIDRYDEMAVMGFVEVLTTIPRHFMLLRRLAERLQSGKVALLVVVDYPGFNMKLAEEAFRAGVPVLYYVTPQVWAWGAGRLPALRRVVTRAAVILPFEETLLRGHGIRADFVGHPLLDRAGDLPSRARAREMLGLKDDDTVLALFPGSRAQEVSRHLADFVDTAELLGEHFPGLKVIVSAASTARIPEAECPFPIVYSAPFAVLKAADAALCKSGTTTLEAAICGCPLVVAYRTGLISFLLARQFVKIPHIALVNVVAGREVVKEFVQDALDPPAVARTLVPLLTPDSVDRARMLADLAKVRAKLGESGAALRVARMASELVK